MLFYLSFARVRRTVPGDIGFLREGLVDPSPPLLSQKCETRQLAGQSFLHKVFGFRQLIRLLEELLCRLWGRETSSNWPKQQGYNYRLQRRSTPLLTERIGGSLPTRGISQRRTNAFEPVGHAGWYLQPAKLSPFRTGHYNKQDFELIQPEFILTPCISRMSSQRLIQTAPLPKPRIQQCHGLRK